MTIETKTYTTIDRKAEGWGSGPWDGEPDKMQWPDPATGLPCLAVRGPARHWCGYVGVPPGHPAFEKSYDDDVLLEIRVHGSLTFSDVCADKDEATSICHVAPGEDKVWWLGFDCGHAGDRAPIHHGLFSPFFRGDSTYRSLAYVQEQCALLAQQLKELSA